MKPNIYLDLDGVCTDFPTAAIAANGRNPLEVFSTWENGFLGEFHPYKVMGIGREEYWETIAARGEEFWINLREYDWYADLFKSLKSMGNVVFLSSATYAPHSLSGKLKWIQERHGQDFQDYILTARKYLLANSMSILVDDYEENVTVFRENGGRAVLFPQIWNSNHRVSDKLKFTVDMVKLHCTDIKDTEQPDKRDATNRARWPRR